MLVEIPDPELILGIILTFFGGLGALYLFYKLKSHYSKPELKDDSYFPRFEFYEKQLIDMKITLDSLEILKENSGLSEKR